MSRIKEVSEYDNNRKKKKNIQYNISNKFKIKNNKDIVEIRHKNKLLYEALYKTVGIYNMTKMIWYWGWFIEYADRNLVDDTKNVKKWGEQMLKNNKIKTKQEQAIYFYTQEGSYMTGKENIDFIVKLAMYILKGKYFFINKHQEDESNVVYEYIIITKKVL